MDKILHRLKQEFSGWQRWEVIYIFSCTAVIGTISVHLGDNYLGIISAITGTLYTMLAGKGKVSCYFFGIINTAIYGYISYSQKIYGDMMLNWLIYLPMMFAGIILWKRRLADDGSVIKARLKLKSILFLTAANILAILLYGIILARFRAAQPFLDAATTVLSVTAMILTLKRCIEQWILWTAVNSLSVFMWFRVFFTTGGTSAATLLWWIIMLITGIIFFIQWKQALNKEIQRS